MNERECAMRKVQMYDFERIEANLYLDAYPYSEQALEYFLGAKNRSECAKREYEEKYGPLTAKSVDGNNGWDWINSPWPWECEG